MTASAFLAHEKGFNSNILDMAVAPDGSVAIAGFTYANVQFGSTPVTGPGGMATGFIARLSPNGRWK